MKLSIILMALLALSACGGDEPAKKPEAKNGGVIPQHQLDAMQKAKNLEDVLQQSEQQRREAVEEANN